MSSYRNIPFHTVMSQTISSGTTIQSLPLNIPTISQVGFLVNVGSGLTATLQLMISVDGTNYYDSGMTLPAVSGSAITIPVNQTVNFPYCLIQVTYGSGSGLVTIVGGAKT
jgi:hypothetical protein